MRYQRRTWVMATACAVTAVALGCAKAPTCEVSPVDIEELREDVAMVEKDLVGVRDRARQLADELATKQADLESKKARPEELRRRLDLLKRGSGRIEKPKPGATTPANPDAEPSMEPAPRTKPKKTEDEEGSS